MNTLLPTAALIGAVLAASLDVKFPSLNKTSAGSLYLPIGNGPFPITVTGPGFAGVKEMLIPDYAEALAKAGIATLAFDYIGWGASTGKTRQDIKPEKQIQTYKDAISFVAKDNRFDAKRIGAWGTTLGGAHTLMVIADDPRVKAGVAIIPHIKIDQSASSERLGMTGSILADALAEATGGKRVMIAVSGAPGSQAAMTSDGAVEWTKNVTRNAPNYKNEVTAASLLAMGTYNTEAAAKRIKIPLRAIAATDDSITPGKYIHAALDGVPGVDIRDFPGTHFGLFGANLTATIELTVDWFKQKL